MESPRICRSNWRKQSPIILSAALAFMLYFNTLNADFVYDDSRAIITNQDLRPESSWSQLWKNDFWGTPLRHSGSHKSYRPLTVATFRVNYYFNELRPFGYHLVNVLLHVFATALVASLSARLSNDDPMIVWTSGLLFASHPIHTEAVAGVVGRADLLTTMCFLLCIRDYLNAINYELDSSDEKTSRKSIIHTFLCLFWATAAVLSKEHGLTVLGVCLLYDLALTSRPIEEANSISAASSPWQRQNRRFSVHERRQRPKQTGDTQKQCISWLWLVHLWRMFVEWINCRFESIKLRATIWTYSRWTILVSYSIFITFFRLWLMNFTAPSFSPSDNPAAHSVRFLTRLMTFSYLASFNFFLLLCPNRLSFDWSMDAIPLLEVITDYRNLITLSVFIFLIIFSIFSVIKITSNSSNAAKFEFKTPKSANFKKELQLDVNGNWNGRVSPTKTFFHCPISNCVANTNSMYRSKFRGKNLDLPLDLRNMEEIQFSRPFWEDNILFVGLLIAIISFLPAVNLCFYVGFVVAERILYLPSVGYCFLIAVATKRLWRFCTTKFNDSIFFCVCLIFLSVLSCKTIIRNGDWRNEENLYLSGIPVNPAKAFSNLGNVYAQQRRVNEAVRAYQKALAHRPNMADTHYNFGILLQEKGDWKGAAVAYQNAIKCRPRMALAHLNMGIALTSLQRLKEAEERYKICANLNIDGLKDPKTHENAQISCLYNLGRLHADQKKYQEAIDVYQLAIGRLNPFYQAHSLYNAFGDVLSKTGQHKEAEAAFKISLVIKADHMPAHLTYGHLLAKTGRNDEAEQLFQRATQLVPLDKTAWQHLAQFYVDHAKHHEASKSYARAWQIDQNDFDTAFGLANVYRNLGQNELAEEFYGKAAQLKPLSANAHMNFAAMLHFNKKWKEAEKEYAIALQQNPEDELTKENLRKLRKSISTLRIS